MKSVGLAAASFTLFITFPVFSLASSHVPSIVQENETTKGEATVWYLGHCGYAVKTRNHLLIFDYIELEENPVARSLGAGFIDPEEIKDLNVSVFVTHSHVDHYDEIIFGWKEVVKNIKYFFGWNAKEDSQYHYLSGPRAEIKVGDMEIYTVNSHHSDVPEVAYLVKVDDLVIFHGGDYQGRLGRNAPSNVLDDMKYLKTKVNGVDLLFIGAWTGDCYLQIIENLKPRVIFPMHERKREHKYLEFASDLQKRGFAYPVICPKQRGDKFTYTNGKIR